MTRPTWFDVFIAVVSIAAGVLAGLGLAMALIAAQRSPVPPSPVDPVEIKRTENMSCTSLC